MFNRITIGLLYTIFRIHEISINFLFRKARCLLALGKYNLACDVFKQTVTALDEAKLPIERRQKWQKDIQIMLAMMNKNRSRTTVNRWY